MRNQHIKTELPGPRARALIARDANVISPSYPRDYPFAMSHGRGTEVWDVDGNRFLDFASGIAVCATGHSHPQVVEAVQQAAAQGKSLDALTLGEYQSLSAVFDAGVFAVFDPQESVSRRNVYGGTAPEAVAAQLVEAHNILE